MTGLTVPVAGIEPGRAARAGQIVPDAGGDALAEFGEVMQNVGLAVQRDRAQREMQRFNIDILRDVGGLRQQVMQMDDPDAAEDAWRDGLAGLRSTYGLPDPDPGAEGGGSLDPRALAFDDLATRQAIGLGARITRQRAAQREQLQVAQAVEAENAYVTADDSLTRDEIAGWYFDGIDARVASGEIAPDEGEAVKASWIDSAETARVVTEVDTDDDQAWVPVALTPADEIARRIAIDPAAARLARVVGYAPTDPAAVEDFQEYLTEMDDTGGDAGRNSYVDDIANLENEKARASAPRPKYYDSYAAGGGITLDGLHAAAVKTVAAHQDGRMGAAEYDQQVRVLQYLIGTFEDGDFMPTYEGPVRDISRRLAADPEANRLAKIVGYTPNRFDVVEEFQEYLTEMDDAGGPAEQHNYVNEIAEIERGRATAAGVEFASGGLMDDG